MTGSALFTGFIQSGVDPQENSIFNGCAPPWIVCAGRPYTRSNKYINAASAVFGEFECRIFFHRATVSICSKTFFETLSRCGNRFFPPKGLPEFGLGPPALTRGPPRI